MIHNLILPNYVVAPPPPDSHTLLLLKGNNFEDSSQYKVPVTNYGVVVSTEQSKFDGKSLYFNGEARLEIPSSAVNIQNKDFTVDLWAYSFDTSRDNYFLDSEERGNLGFGTTGGDLGTLLTHIQWTHRFPLTYEEKQWIHFAVCKKQSTIYFFKNGKLLGTESDTTAYGNNDTTMTIGSEGLGYYYYGYIDEFRISDVARWTSNFTPPTKPY